MKVLLVGAEVSPLVKIGGLGDVMGGLPKALQKLGLSIDVIVPFYSNIEIQPDFYKCFDLNVSFAGENFRVGVFKTKLPGSEVRVFMLKNDHFFSHGGIDAFSNNITETEMFMFFNKSVVEFIKSQFNVYDLVHCNDWHTGLITHLLNDELGMTRPATLFTIHNVIFQGVGEVSSIADVGLNCNDHPLIDWDVSDGDLNMMLQGVSSSDYISTVSPSYAEEILTEEFGGGLHDIFRSRKSRLVGILNGVDYSMLPRDYARYNVSQGKEDAKKLLCETLGVDKRIPHWQNVPIFSYIGRVDPGQKGLELLEDLFLDPSFEDRAIFVFLGKGDFGWEERFKKIKNRNLFVNILFDESLAIKMYAGSDFLLIPSKYEPCGLIQMMAMYYGTIPIARNVGGLKDTVKDGVTGFCFEKYVISDFKNAVERALDLYDNRSALENLVHNCMSQDFSWDRSAKLYMKLYEKVVHIHKYSVRLAEM